MMKVPEGDERQDTDMSISMQSDLNVSGAGFKLSNNRAEGKVPEKMFSLQDIEEMKHQY